MANRWNTPLLLILALVTVTAVYWPGLSGQFLFDDYPNIVENKAVQPANASMATLTAAALSSPSSEFKRPLASLSFAANFLATGLDPRAMKITNLILHLLNGLLVFFLTNMLLHQASRYGPHRIARREIIATIVAATWMLLPINLTAVLYVVQRMESMANLFVLIGLIGYISGRNRMLGAVKVNDRSANRSEERLGLALCAGSILIPTLIGVFAKETAAMLPLYAFLIEWFIFRFRLTRHISDEPKIPTSDKRIVVLFSLTLALPLIIGMAWLLPGILRPETWAIRDFTLRTRLLSEARIIVDYIYWTLIPSPNGLSFYHDNFVISQGLLTPWTTLLSIGCLVGLVVSMVYLRKRQPVAALGIGFFLGCQLLTGTIIPLELIYEHRNYFASLGLMLIVVPWLCAPSEATRLTEKKFEPSQSYNVSVTQFVPLAVARYTLLIGLIVCWASVTAMTAYAWGSPLRLAQELADRAPNSPRAQYELGRTYIIYSNYDPSSPFTKLAYAPLERSAALPESSILPEQALIFMSARMNVSAKDTWWDSLISKLKQRKPTIQDESSLAALTKCGLEQLCKLPQERMKQAFAAALSHPNPSARLLANYSDYAWNTLQDKSLGLKVAEQAVATDPREPVYRVTEIRMLAFSGQTAQAQLALDQLNSLNVGGSLDKTLSELRTLPGLH